MAMVAPVAAHATTKEVYMGEPPATQNNFERNYSSDVNDFFPHGITIHVNDKVKFMPGFHTVDFPPRGGKPQSFITPGGPAASAKDEAGNPFWFNGQPTFTLNPAILKPATKATYNGKARAESGLNAGPGQPSPFVVKFTKKGSFTYYCDVHPGMKGVVHVVAKTAKAPSAKSDAKAVKKQVAAALATAKKLSQTQAPTATILVGAGGPGNVDYYGFFGPKDPIAVGTTVRFQMGKGSLEQHTASTDTGASSAPPPAPGGNDQIPDAYLNGLAGTFQGPGPFDPRATYASDQPGGTPASLTPTLHGNGFWNTGVIDNATVTPLPSNQTVRFDAPGTYTFYCLIHTFMHVTVKVQ